MSTTLNGTNEHSNETSASNLTSNTQPHDDDKIDKNKVLEVVDKLKSETSNSNNMKQGVKRAHDDSRKQFVPPANPLVLSGNDVKHSPSTPPIRYNGKAPIQPRVSAHGTSPASMMTSLSIKNDPRERFGHFKRCINDYTKEVKLGEGTYGEVFRAKSNTTGEIVAIKKVRMDREKEGFPITAIREITILKSIQHENIVQLKEVVASLASDKPNFFMVFEYIEHDLAGLLEAKVPFTESHIKSLMKQLLEALHQCHSVNILHRDLKASNLLITQKGVLKLADFGLSRFMQQGKNRYTNRVITRWYRPPELLLGATEYSTKIDMWSVGCILGEILLSSKAVFPGASDLDQLDLIFQTCGTPTMESWADVSKLPLWKDFKPQKEHKRVLFERFKNTPYSEEAIDLLDKLLVLDPEKRLSAKECLTHDWFWKGGDPERPTNLPTISCNELSTRKKRKERGHAYPPPVSHNPHVHPSQYHPDMPAMKRAKYSHNTSNDHPPSSSHNGQHPIPPRGSSHGGYRGASGPNDAHSQGRSSTHYSGPPGGYQNGPGHHGRYNGQRSRDYRKSGPPYHSNGPRDGPREGSRDGPRDGPRDGGSHPPHDDRHHHKPYHHRPHYNTGPRDNRRYDRGNYHHGNSGNNPSSRDNHHERSYNNNGHHRGGTPPSNTTTTTASSSDPVRSQSSSGGAEPNE